jgi:uncharacterized membrane protein YdjX (TVP38/TMEM64 family)
MTLKKLIPIAILVVGLIIIYFSGLLDYLSYDTLKEHRKTIVAFVQNHFFLSVLIYITVYTLGVAFSIPSGGFMTILGGFLFPQPLSTIFVVIGATTGSTLLFLAAKTAFRDFFAKRIGRVLKKMEKGFLENPASYLLFLRFVPLFPFWLVNLAPAFFGVHIWTYIWTTFIGIIPGSFVYAQAGAGLGAIFDTDQPFSIASVFNWKMRVALICLAIFSLIPIVVKKLRKKKDIS